MQKLVGKQQDTIFALTRIAVGFLFFCHGAQKLFGLFGGRTQPLFSLMGLAGVIEFAGGLLVMVGLFTGWAAFICSGQMAVAYFMSHSPRGLLPISNGGELSALYAWVFLHIATRSAGPWSLDSLRKR
jgi:putative oxidoreductase